GSLPHPPPCRRKFHGTYAQYAQASLSALLFQDLLRCLPEKAGLPLQFSFHLSYMSPSFFKALNVSLTVLTVDSEPNAAMTSSSSASSNAILQASSVCPPSIIRTFSPFLRAAALAAAASSFEASPLAFFGQCV